ncbi:MAG: hypothetical protein K0R62_5253 [Nonomuraea muscovyensis]|nr:hypothetical protein [Nonomuraea muscovyensis]
MDFTISEFLGHACEDGGDSPTWHAEIQVAACAHLLNQWLEEDAPEHEACDARLLVDLRETTNRPAESGIASLLNSGVLPALSPDGPTREPLSCEPIPVSEAATAIERALSGTPTSRRVGLMSAALRASLQDWAEEAVLVTASDPAGGGVVDETHVVFSFFSSLVRVSVVRMDDRGIGRDPACLSAGHWCDGDPHTAEFLTEVEAFRAACLEEAAGNESGELVPHLLDELLDGPIRRVGGPERRLRVWADADADGRLRRDPFGGIDQYDHAPRLLVLGPDEAMYIVFKGEKNC